jgi:hypothetical protein
MIAVHCYETDEETLIIEGSLTDERLFPFVIHAINKKRGAGLMHQITVTIELSIPQLKIISAKAERPAVPEEGCRDIKEAIRKLAGLSIQPGFTNETRKILGKVSGCLHLTNLILSMRSAAAWGGLELLQSREGRVSCPGLPQSGRIYAAQ